MTWRTAESIGRRRHIYSRSIRVPKFADTDPSKKKFADTDQRIGTKKAWQRTRRPTTLVLFLESEHHAHRRQHSWSLNAGGLVAGALWLSMQTRRTPGLGLSFRCMRRRSVPVPDLATSSALTAQPVWIGGNRQHALCRTHCVPCWAESYRSRMDAEVDWHSGMAGQRQSDDEHVTWTPKGDAQLQWYRVVGQSGRLDRETSAIVQEE